MTFHRKEQKIMKETSKNLTTLTHILKQTTQTMSNKVILEILSSVITNLNHLKERKFVSISIKFQKFEDLSDDESCIYKVGGKNLKII